MKDLSELLQTTGDLTGAEKQLRKTLELTPDDSDALFSLGVVVSEIGGRDEEVVEAYIRSAEINREDYELLYNLAVKFGERGDRKKEVRGERGEQDERSEESFFSGDGNIPYALVRYDMRPFNTAIGRND